MGGPPTLMIFSPFFSEKINTNDTLIFSLPFFPKNITNNITLIGYPNITTIYTYIHILFCFVLFVCLTKIQNSQNSLMLLQQQQPNFNTNDTLIFSLPLSLAGRPPAGRPPEKILKILLQQQHQQPDDDDDDFFPFFPQKILLFLIIQKYYKR